MLTNEFDAEKTAIINPTETIERVENFPKGCIGIFSKVIIEALLNEYGRVQIGSLASVNGRHPVWKITKDGVDYAVFMAMVGAPMACGQIEEIGAMGAEIFVLYGCCGVLDSTIDHGNIVLVTSAVRDEGISYHYLPASDEIELERAEVESAEVALKELKYPYIKGKTWTTDAFYRETRAKMERRRAQGCIVVEMECAAAAAVAKFRGYTFAQFLFAADNLDGEEWQRRSLGDGGINGYDIYMNAAFKICNNLRALRESNI